MAGRAGSTYGDRRKSLAENTIVFGPGDVGIAEMLERSDDVRAFHPAARGRHATPERAVVKACGIGVRMEGVLEPLPDGALRWAEGRLQRRLLFEQSGTEHDVPENDGATTAGEQFDHLDGLEHVIQEGTGHADVEHTLVFTEEWQGVAQQETRTLNSEDLLGHQTLQKCPAVSLQRHNLPGAKLREHIGVAAFQGSQFQDLGLGEPRSESAEPVIGPMDPRILEQPRRTAALEFGKPSGEMRRPLAGEKLDRIDGTGRQIDEGVLTRNVFHAGRDDE